VNQNVTCRKKSGEITGFCVSSKKCKGDNNFWVFSNGDFEEIQEKTAEATDKKRNRQFTESPFSRHKAVLFSGT